MLVDRLPSRTDEDRAIQTLKARELAHLRRPRALAGSFRFNKSRSARWQEHQAVGRATLAEPLDETNLAAKRFDALAQVLLDGAFGSHFLFPFNVRRILSKCSAWNSASSSAL